MNLFQHQKLHTCKLQCSSTVKNISNTFDRFTALHYTKHMYLFISIPCWSIIIANIIKHYCFTITSSNTASNNAIVCHNYLRSDKLTVLAYLLPAIKFTLQIQLNYLSRAYTHFFQLHCSIIKTFLFYFDWKLSSRMMPGQLSYREEVSLWLHTHYIYCCSS
jgi:hypothetical protein